MRYYRPSKKFLRELFGGRTLCKHSEPTEHELSKILLEHGEDLVLTVSRAACTRVNAAAIRYLFAGKIAFAFVQMDDNEGPTSLYKDMRIIITQNRDKKNGVINSQTGAVLNYEQGTIFLLLPNSSIVAVHLVTEVTEEGTRRTFYPIVPAYSTTICKIQGQTLGKVIIWLDCPWVPQGTAYVALPRLRKLDDLFSMVYGSPNQFLPVEMLKE